MNTSMFFKKTRYCKNCKHADTSQYGQNWVYCNEKEMPMNEGNVCIHWEALVEEREDNDR